MRTDMVDVVDLEGGAQLTVELLIEIDGVDRPACAAQAVFRHTTRSTELTPGDKGLSALSRGPAEEERRGMNTLPSSVRVAGSRHARGWVAAQISLSVLAAAIFAFRAVRTAVDGPFVGTAWVVAGVGLASIAALLALGAAAVARRPGHWSAGLLGGALVLELVVLGGVAAPPRLIAALPLAFALALAVTPAPRVGSPGTTSGHVSPRVVAAVIALALMLPVGFFYLTSGLVVPVPWLFGVYVLFGVQVLGAVRLAKLRSWWVLASPLLAAALLFALVSFGDAFLGWTG